MIVHKVLVMFVHKVRVMLVRVEIHVDAGRCVEGEHGAKLTDGVDRHRRRVGTNGRGDRHQRGGVPYDRDRGRRWGCTHGMKGSQDAYHRHTGNSSRHSRKSCLVDRGLVGMDPRAAAD